MHLYMRNIEISVDENYHVYNRGAHKQIIFHDVADYARFLFLILYFQSNIGFDQISRYVRRFVQHRVFDMDTEDVTQIISGRYVELLSFCLMPNHFHLILREVEENGIARYMQRVLNSYTKYYNTKYEVSGHLFQGPYKAVHIEDNEQLIYLSTYIHRNPLELPRWASRWEEYEWSSYQDYISENRWGELLSMRLILEQFKSKDEYRNFTLTSSAKTSGTDFAEI